MNILNIIKSVLSYIFTFFVGVYALSFFYRGVDFFGVLGCVACALLAIFTSSLLPFLFTSKRK